MELELQLDTAMFNIYRRAKAEAGYNASRYLQMLDGHRGLKTAQILLHAATVSEGYVALWEKKRLDLTVEALVIQRRYRELFTDAEIDIAHERLRQYGYRTDRSADDNQTEQG